jgi:MFS family permease
MIAAKICCMAGSAAFASTLVELSRLWRLDATRAGWIGSGYLIGYAAAVPLLVGLTDRIDARAVFLFGCTIGAIAFGGFALFAHGMCSAFIFQAMAGIALAGTYMPGLRVLTQRLTARARIRAVPYYTGAFGVGTAASFLVSGWAAARFGWQATFVAGAAGSIAGAILMALTAWNVPPAPDFSPTPSLRHPLDFRPVLRNREMLAYVFAYGGHCWELFAFRAWLPAFLLFAWARSSGGDPGLAIARWSMLIVLIGVPSSIIGAEFAQQGNRNRLLRSFEFGSIVTAAVGAIWGGLSFHLAVIAMFAYNAAITADSGALTAGTVAIAKPHEQGAALAIYSLVGFGGGAIGPLLVGGVLDLGGGLAMPRAWYGGFAAMAAGSALAAIAVSIGAPLRIASGATGAQTDLESL